MTTFEGPAVVTGDGREYEVEASLVMTTEEVRVPNGESLQGLREWHGTLTAQDDGAAWAIFEADDSRLRIGNREGAFISTNAQGGSDSIVIQGSGPAPFGD